ncbi:hypothetical protein BH23BAC4_BH23BAC4_14160 [soil metagenome]
MNHITRISLAFSAIGLLVLVAATPFSARYTVDADSRFWIDGTSTMGTYVCESSRVSGQGRVDGGDTRMEAEIVVPVRAFDCGQSRMNRDFIAALRADRHPDLRFLLHRAEMLDQEAHPGAWVRVRARGTIRLAGTERPIVIEARGRRLGNNQVRIRGSHALRMTDFGVDPPSGLMGLVRAHDQVVARFDLVARTD